MKRLWVLSCCLLVTLATWTRAGGQTPNRRPNIVYIFADDHAKKAISAYGEALIETPNIDRIAREGMVFKSSFCANAICGPSRATVLTGLHSHANGFTGNGGAFDGSQQTFPQLLQASGYQTALVGKWHLGSEPTGFDHWEILPGQGFYYNPDFKTADGRVRHEGYCTDIIAERSINWLTTKRDPGRPFLLMCQHKAPHRNWMAAERHFGALREERIPTPQTLFDDYDGRTAWLKANKQSINGDMSWAHDMKLPGENLDPSVFGGVPNAEWGRMTEAQRTRWEQAYKPANDAFILALSSGELSDRERVMWVFQRYIREYLRCIMALDEAVGRVLEYLDESGLAENTIVIYSSDQGFFLGEHGWYDKRWMFEESMFMPLLVRWPGVISPGTDSHALVQNIDHAPTILEASGVQAPKPMHGRSLVPLMRTGGTPPKDWRDAVYYAYYMFPSVHHVPIHNGVRTDRHKLMWIPQTEEWQLFDLKADPHEMRSVHDNSAYAATMARMRMIYRALRIQFDVEDGPLIETILEQAASGP